MLKNLRQSPSGVKDSQIAARKDHWVGSQQAGLCGKLAIVKQDKRYPHPVAFEPLDQSQHVALNPTKQLTDCANGNTIDGFSSPHMSGYFVMSQRSRAVS